MDNDDYLTAFPHSADGARIAHIQTSDYLSDNDKFIAATIGKSVRACDHRAAPGYSCPRLEPKE